jgi:hypothetical protein
VVKPATVHLKIMGGLEVEVEVGVVAAVVEIEEDRRNA